MEMTSSTWRSSGRGKLIGCGVDVESVDRFQQVAENDDHPMPFVFTVEELEHARSRKEPARALCIAFSCKEALRKALPEPYNYTECEVFPDFDAEGDICDGPLHLSLSALSGERLAAAMRTMVNPMNRNEMITSVYVFKEARP